MSFSGKGREGGEGREWGEGGKGRESEGEFDRGREDPLPKFDLLDEIDFATESKLHSV